MELARRRRRAHGGFTLIELLIALGLSTVGLLGLLALQIVAIRGNTMSRGFSEATGIAQSQIEAAARTPYANLSTLVEGTCAVYPTTTAPNCTGAPTTTVSPDPHTTTQNVYTRCTAVTVDTVNVVTTVQVSVCWKDLSTKLTTTHALTMYTQRSP
jgi:prepilin-type N-terminal cleavage/methylation domain-containing protein